MKVSVVEAYKETESISVYEGPRLRSTSKRDILKVPDVSSENVEDEPEEKKEELKTKTDDSRRNEKRIVTFSSPEGMMPFLKMDFSGTAKTSLITQFENKKNSSSPLLKPNFKRPQRNRKMTKSNQTPQIMRDLMLKQKLVRFIDNLRANSGIRNIRKCSLKTLKLINDLSYEHKKDWNIHEETSTKFNGIKEVFLLKKFPFT
jgi:hypothetical protein